MTVWLILNETWKSKTETSALGIMGSIAKTAKPEAASSRSRPRATGRGVVAQYVPRYPALTKGNNVFERMTNRVAHAASEGRLVCPKEN